MVTHTIAMVNGPRLALWQTTSQCFCSSLLSVARSSDAFDPIRRSSIMTELGLFGSKISLVDKAI